MELHDYQKYAVRFIEEHPIAALFLDMGLGKTITTLTAIVISIHLLVRSLPQMILCGFSPFISDY